MSADEELEAVLDVEGAAEDPAGFAAVAVAVVDVADPAGARDGSDVVVELTAAVDDDDAPAEGRATVALGDTFPATVGGRPACWPGGAAARGRADKGGRALAGRADA